MKRRTVLRSAVALSIGSLAGCITGGSTSNTNYDWQSFGYDNANTRHTPATAPTESVQEQWHFETDGAVSSAPAVVDGTVYMGNGDSHVYAVDAETGDEEWRFETGDRVHSSPAVLDETVYVGSYDGNLYAIDSQTGDEEWRFETGDRIHPSPNVINGVVYISSADGNVYAVATESGDEEWTFETNGVMRLSSPAVVDGRVFVGNVDREGGKLYAIDADSGEEQWQFEAGDEVATPAVTEGIVYVGCRDGNVYAVDAETGDENWHFETDARQVASSPAIVDGSVYIPSGTGTLYSLNTTDGTVQWQEALTGEYGWVPGSPTVADDTVYIGNGRSEDDYVYALAVDDGEQRWQFETGDSIFSSPAVVGGTVYVGSHDGNVYAISASD